MSDPINFRVVRLTARALLILIFSVLLAGVGYLLDGGLEYSRAFAPEVPVSLFARLEGARAIYLAARSETLDGDVARWLGLPVTGGVIEANLHKAHNPARATQMTPAMRHTYYELVIAEHAGLTMAIVITCSVPALLLLVLVVVVQRRKGADVRRLRLATRESRFAFRRRPQIEICGIPLRRQDECRNQIVVGVPGTGKSQLLASIIRQILARGDTLIVVDRGPAFVQHFIKPGDVTVNPFDRRTVDLSPLAEIHNALDMDTYASMLWPTVHTSEAGAFFCGGARQVFRDGVSSPTITTNGALCSVLQSERHLAEAIRGTASEAYLRAREWGGIYATIVNALPWLPYLPSAAGHDAYSVRGFVKAIDSHPGRAMWLTVPDAYHESLDALVGVILGLVLHEVLALPPSLTRRLWVVTDELGNLPTIGDFARTLSQSRDRGLCVVSGIQDIAQIREKYGPEGASILTSCYSTWLVLRCRNHEVAEAMSRLMGDREVTEWRRTEASGSAGSGRTSSSSRTEQIRSKRIVPASDIQRLPDMAGYLSMAQFSPVRVRVPYRALPDTTDIPGFVARVLPPVHRQAAPPATHLNPNTGSPPDVLDIEGLK